MVGRIVLHATSGVSELQSRESGGETKDTVFTTTVAAAVRIQCVCVGKKLAKTPLAEFVLQALLQHSIDCCIVFVGLNCTWFGELQLASYHCLCRCQVASGNWPIVTELALSLSVPFTELESARGGTRCMPHARQLHKIQVESF